MFPFTEHPQPHLPGAPDTLAIPPAALVSTWQKTCTSHRATFLLARNCVLRGMCRLLDSDTQNTRNGSVCHFLCPERAVARQAKRSQNSSSPRLPAHKRFL